MSEQLRFTVIANPDGAVKTTLVTSDEPPSVELPDFKVGFVASMLAVWAFKRPDPTKSQVNKCRPIAERALRETMQLAHTTGGDDA